jgi:hypothetical protein
MKHLPLLALLPSLLFAAPAIWDGTADTTWYTNDKEATEYTITTAEQLAGLALLVNESEGNGVYDMLDKTIKLGDNIILNDTTDWQSWDETTEGLNQWMGINWFLGTFDGDGYVISGIYGSQGLFKSISSSSTIKNLGVVA